MKDVAEFVRGLLAGMSDNDRKFYGSLLQAFDAGRLSEKQAFYLQKKHDDVMARRAMATTAKQEVLLPRTVALFQHAMSKGIETPTIRLSIGEKAGRIAIRAVRTKRGDLIAYVNDRDRTFTTRDGMTRKTGYGTIDLATGRFEVSTYADPTLMPFVLSALIKFESDPEKVGALEGHATGCCCYCGLKLTQAASVAVGYGPICADNYGLPWGEGSREDNLVNRMKEFREKQLTDGQ